MDRRKFTRVGFRSLAVVKSRLSQIKATVEDLSLNGTKLKTAHKFDLGKDVQIEILLKSRFSDLWVEILGTVVRHDGDGMAIQFVNMSLDSHLHIRNLISNRLHDGRKTFDEFFAHLTNGSAKGPGAAVEFAKMFSIKVDQQMVPV